jgi:hypothetical protein
MAARVRSSSSSSSLKEELKGRGGDKPAVAMGGGELFGRSQGGGEY